MSYGINKHRKSLLGGMIAIMALAVLPFSVSAKAADGMSGDIPSEVTLIKGARIFNGVADKLIDGKDVLIKDGRIAKIAADIKPSDGTTVVNAKGLVMTPGFIDGHAHLMLQMSYAEGLYADEFYHAYVATRTARQYLMHGFTTVRDVMGNTYSLKSVIDQGIVVGPRIYPSGPLISQTSGHGDHRTAANKSNNIKRDPDLFTKYFHAAVADGRPEVLNITREALHRGSSQIKIAVGGGTGTQTDPLDVVQFTDDEIRAAVEAAADWHTYVTAHVYNSEGIQRAIRAGVKCIEHGQLMDEKTMKMMMKNDIWLSPQVIVYTYIPKGYTEDQAAKHRQAYDGIDNMFKMAKRLGFKKISFGTDIITDPEMIERMNEEFVFRTKWFDNAEVLRQATSKSGELLALSGPRNPYPGKLGVIEEGAHADLLLINGNPLEDISILTKYNESLVLIMKGGEIYKNLLQRPQE